MGTRMIAHCSNIRTLEEIPTWAEYCDTHREAIQIRQRDTLSGSPGNRSYRARKCLNDKISVYYGDITEVDVDAVVCSADRRLDDTPVGVSQAVRNKAGPQMYQQLYGRTCQPGAAIITPGYGLPANYVIHTVGSPPHEEDEVILRQCYESSLSYVQSRELKSIAFPCLCTGGRGFDIDRAATIAVETVRLWLQEPGHKQLVKRIVFCLYSDDQWPVYFDTLTKMFPPATDEGDFDVDDLEPVPIQRLALPKDCCGVSTIFCFTFHGEEIRNTICKSGREMAEEMHIDITSTKDILDKHYPVLVSYCKSTWPEHLAATEVYKDCIIIQISLNERLIIRYNRDKLSLEFQVIKLSTTSDDPGPEICFDIRDKLTGHLLNYLGPYLAFQTYIRCPLSQWETQDGVWSVEKLRGLPQEHVCFHSQSVEAHKIEPTDLLFTWFMQENKARERPNIDERPSDKSLRLIANYLGSKHIQLGLILGVPSGHLQRIQINHQHDAWLQAFTILTDWRGIYGKDKTLGDVLDAMDEVGVDTEDIKSQLLI